MLTITDRDLLVIEPTLFTHAASAATTLLSGSDGSIEGATFTSAVDFEAQDIDAGHVIRLVGRDQSIEVVQRQSSTVMDVSLPRWQAEGAALAPGDGADLEFTVPSFVRIIALERQILSGRFRLDETIGVNKNASTDDGHD